MDSFDLHHRAQQALQPGEKLLWTGQPDPNVIVRKVMPSAVVSFFAFLFSAALFAFLLPALVSAESGEDIAGLTLMLRVIAVLDVFVAFLFLARPLFERRIAEQTLYALTDQRALILVPKPPLLARFGSRPSGAYTRGRVHRVELVNRDDGTGDVLFFVPLATSRSTTAGVRPGFYGIPNPQYVYSLAQETFGQSPQK